MKAFEEFWKDYQHKPHFSPNSVAKDVWKAALEWALTQVSSGVEDDGSISKSTLVSVHYLEEELKGDN